MKKKQLFTALAVYLVYLGFILASNLIMKIGVHSGNQTYEMVSGMIFGFIAIPVLSIILPLWLAARWKLEHSFWPRRKKLWLVLAALCGYVLIANFGSLKTILSQKYFFPDLLVHYFSSLLFHASYYPLFAVLIFPVVRKNFGLLPALVITALCFSIYHLTQFHFFPAGTTPFMQFFLFISFLVSLLFYLWSESLILVALTHSANGAIGLLANGTIFKELDFLFYLTIVIIGGLFSYMTAQALRNKPAYNKDWWLKVT